MPQVTIESLKYDIKEKTELLQEASNAIESLETRLATTAVEREEERSRLEYKLKQLEEDLGDQTSSILFGTQLLIDQQSAEQKIAGPDLPFSSTVDATVSVKLPR